MKWSVLSALALAGVAGADPSDQAVLTVEPIPGKVMFRVWNPTPFAAPASSARIRFLRRGQDLGELRQALPGLPPFRSTTVEVPDWSDFAPGRVRLCVDTGRESSACAQQVLPGTRPDLLFGAVRIEGDRVVADLRNEGDVESGGFEVRVTTRAAGRVVGTATHAVSSLGPRSAREESFQLERWGQTTRSARPLFAEDCCTTELRLDPDGLVEEADEDNNGHRLHHPPD